MDLVKLLEKDTMGMLPELLKDIVEERWGKWVDDDAWLEIVKSAYVLGVAGMGRN